MFSASIRAKWTGEIFLTLDNCLTGFAKFTDVWPGNDLKQVHGSLSQDRMVSVSLSRCSLHRQSTLCTVCVCVPCVGDVAALASGARADRHNVTLALAPWHRLAHCECGCRATIGATAPLLEPPGGDYLPGNIAHQQSLSAKALLLVLLNSSQNQLRAYLVAKKRCSILALVPAAAAGDIDPQIFFSKPPFLLW